MEIRFDVKMGVPGHERLVGAFSITDGTEDEIYKQAFFKFGKTLQAMIAIKEGRAEPDGELEPSSVTADA